MPLRSAACGAFRCAAHSLLRHLPLGHEFRWYCLLVSMCLFVLHTQSGAKGPLPTTCMQWLNCRSALD
jgi:hypothetical protein